MYWYLPPICIFLYEENLTKKIRKKTEKRHFNVIFEKTSKKLLKQNSQVVVFLLPGSAFNDERNGTYPPPVSFLNVENLTKISKKDSE